MKNRVEQAVNGLILLIFIVIPLIGIVLGYAGIILGNDRLWKIGVGLASPLIVVTGSIIAHLLISGTVDLVNDVYAAVRSWVWPRR